MNKLQQMRRKLKKTQQNSSEKLIEKKQSIPNEEPQNKNLSNEQLQASQPQKQQPHKSVAANPEKEVNEIVESGHPTNSNDFQKSCEKEPIQSNEQKDIEQKSEVAQRLQFENQRQDPVPKNDYQKQRIQIEPQQQMQQQVQQEHSHTIQQQTQKQKPQEQTIQQKEKSVESQSPSKNQIALQQKEQPKKSKIQMLREKIRLKKISSQQGWSSKSIPEEPSAQKQNQQLLIKDIKEHEDQHNIDEHMGNKKIHLDEQVKQAVLFEGMREDRIPVEALEEIQADPFEEFQELVAQKIDQNIHKKQLENQQTSQLLSQEHQEILENKGNNHTLFYQLNQLKQFFSSQNNSKDFVNQSESKETAENLSRVQQLVSQLEKLRKNIKMYEKLNISQ